MSHVQALVQNPQEQHLVDCHRHVNQDPGAWLVMLANAGIVAGLAAHLLTGLPDSHWSLVPATGTTISCFKLTMA